MRHAQGFASLTLCAMFALVAAVPARGESDELFADDFESGLGKWQVSNPRSIIAVDSGSPEHGQVMQLAPTEARIHALMRGSEGWGSYRLEAEVLFPEDVHNYLGWMYHFVASDRRTDFGSLYIKGNGSYIRVNPHRDYNAGRKLYEEYKTRLTGDDAIRIGQWQRFAAEVSGPVCHFYVGDMTTPKVTFDFYERDRGMAGFKPRVVGGGVWVDNVRVVAIDRLSYRGPRLPAALDYRPETLLTDWQVLGPLTRAHAEIERAGRVGDGGVSPKGGERNIFDDGALHRWRAFATDPRGAVITGRVTEFSGSRTVAYFRTSVEVAEGERARLQFSSIDTVAVWVDGVFEDYWPDPPYARNAWYDFRDTEDDAGLALGPGVNHLLIRVRGGQYATGGFYARVVPDSN